MPCFSTRVPVNFSSVPRNLGVQIFSRVKLTSTVAIFPSMTLRHGICTRTYTPRIQAPVAVIVITAESRFDRESAVELGSHSFPKAPRASPRRSAERNLEDTPSIWTL